jgi:hypothetical protein
MAWPPQRDKKSGGSGARNSRRWRADRLSAGKPGLGGRTGVERHADGFDRDNIENRRIERDRLTEGEDRGVVADRAIVWPGLDRRTVGIDARDTVAGADFEKTEPVAAPMPATALAPMWSA